MGTCWEAVSCVGVPAPRSVAVEGLKPANGGANLRPVADDSGRSGGGIRTPDTRIMIPRVSGRENENDDSKTVPKSAEPPTNPADKPRKNKPGGTG